MEKRCEECGAVVENGKACKDYFDMMLAWDFADFKGAGKVHHLTVLCYYLQHPRLYSPKALEKAKGFVKDIVENHLSVEDLYKRESAVFSSDKRDWSVQGTDAHHGSYGENITWTMTAPDIVKEGVVSYPENVTKWAKSIYIDLRLE